MSRFRDRPAHLRDVRGGLVVRLRAA